MSLANIAKSICDRNFAISESRPGFQRVSSAATSLKISAAVSVNCSGVPGGRSRSGTKKQACKTS